MLTLFWVHVIQFIPVAVVGLWIPLNRSIFTKIGILPPSSLFSPIVRLPRRSPNHHPSIWQPEMSVCQVRFPSTHSSGISHELLTFDKNSLLLPTLRSSSARINAWCCAAASIPSTCAFENEGRVSLKMTMPSAEMEPSISPSAIYTNISVMKISNASLNEADWPCPIQVSGRDFRQQHRFADRSQTMRVRCTFLLISWSTKTVNAEWLVWLSQCSYPVSCMDH